MLMLVVTMMVLMTVNMGSARAGFWKKRLERMWPSLMEPAETLHELFSWVTLFVHLWSQELAGERGRGS